MKITSATTNDQTNSKDILKCIKAKSLIIRDLGYFTLIVYPFVDGHNGF